MARVFMSFVGMGSRHHGYSSAVYHLDGRPAGETRFAQVAEIELLGPESFDRVLLLFTPSSASRYAESIEEELRSLGVEHITLIRDITEEMSADAQWSWFERVLHLVDTGDRLVIDLTHGFRAVSIVLSAALGFMQRAKQVELEHVFYGNVEKQGLLVDMRDFYVVNDWAEAVTRLVDDADAGAIARIAADDGRGRFAALGDPAIVIALQELTGRIRDVDVNLITRKAATALDMVVRKRRDSDPSSRLLLDLIWEKFSGLVLEDPPSGRYDKAYFTLQLTIIELLMQHGLHMQAFTAMREFIGSIGMVGAPEKGTRNMTNQKGRKARRYGGVFIAMVKYPRENWRFTGEEDERRKEQLLPLFTKLCELKIEPVLREVTGDLIRYRNAFDHAWVSVPDGEKQRAIDEIPQKGREFIGRLREVVRLMETNDLIE